MLYTKKSKYTSNKFFLKMVSVILGIFYQTLFDAKKNVLIVQGSGDASLYTVNVPNGLFVLNTVMGITIYTKTKKLLYLSHTHTH